MPKSALRFAHNKFLSLKNNFLDDFIFIHINKNGGTSISCALQIAQEHLTAQEKISKVGQYMWNKKYVFTVVRNPWDRIVSHYHYRVKTNQTSLRDLDVSFSQWIDLTLNQKNPFFYDKPKMFLPQYSWLSDLRGNIIVDNIIRFENLQAEFNSLLEKLDLSATLPHVKKTERGHYRDYFDSDSMKAVENYFGVDIDYFGYSF